MSEKINVDVVIIGAGIAGLSAALEAAQLGAKTVVLERLKTLRGNTYYAGGGSIYKISSACEEVVDEASKTGKGKVDLDLVRIFAQQVNEGIDWLANLGLEWYKCLFPVSGKGTLHNNPIGRYRVKGHGRAICRVLGAAASQRGIDVFYQTRAKKILTNDQGKIVGLRAERKGQDLEFETKSIVLATVGVSGE